MLRYSVLFLSVVTCVNSVRPVEFAKSSFFEPTAKCRFAVHKNGPDGELVSGTALDVQLYYSIECEAVKGYCLRVSNCTVSPDEVGYKPYPIIDPSGCSLEPSLYSNVKYLSDFSAGIANPFPIRFRSSSAAVIFYCVTTLYNSEEGFCERDKCLED